MTMIKLVYRYLIKHNWLINIATLFVASHCATLILALLLYIPSSLFSWNEFLDIGGPEISNWIDVCRAVLVAPIFETVIVYTGIFSLIEAVKQTDRHPFWTIVITTVCFSLLHVKYSFLYSLLILPRALVYAFSYHFFKRTKRTIISIFSVSLIHALNNLWAILINML